MIESVTYRAEWHVEGWLETTVKAVVTDATSSGSLKIAFLGDPQPSQFLNRIEAPRNWIEFGELSPSEAERIADALREAVAWVRAKQAEAR